MAKEKEDYDKAIQIIRLLSPKEYEMASKFYELSVKLGTVRTLYDTMLAAESKDFLGIFDFKEDDKGKTYMSSAKVFSEFTVISKWKDELEEEMKKYTTGEYAQQMNLIITALGLTIAGDKVADTIIKKATDAGLNTNKENDNGEGN